jgi:phage major head subunit gpT-like protein
MDINRENMEALFQNYNTAFTDGMQSAADRPTPEDLSIDEIAMIGASTGAAAVHAWLNQIGGMRKWIGDRVLANIESGKLTVANEDYEKTIVVPRKDIEDDQFGLYTPLVKAMGTSAGTIWMRLAIDALAGNGTWADGKAYFASDRTYGEQTIANVGTAALTADTYKAAKAAMESFVLAGGEPGEVVVTHLVVGPSLRDAAWNIVKNEWVSSGTGKGGAVKNPNAGSCELRVSRRLVGARANYWFLMGTQGGMKPVYVQQRKKPVLTRMDRDTDTNVFMRNEYYYGTDARGAAFLTLPHLAFGGLVTA